MQLLPPYRFRFVEAEDVEAYGDRWWTWDEAAIARLRGRELIALEEAVGMPMIDVFAGTSRNATAEKLAAMWIALHLAGQDIAFGEFNPMVLQARWEQIPEEAAPSPLDAGSGEGQPTPDSGSLAEPATASATSSPA